MKPITLSINPTYLCNFRCDFCYLTEEQLADTHKIDLQRLADMLAHVSKYVSIEHVDLYGGEIGVLPHEYQHELYNTIRKFYNGPINIVTNLLREFPLMHMDNVELSVSYDFEYRERHETVLANLRKITQDVHVLVLASPGVINKDVDQMIALLNTIPRVTSVEIKPYSTNQANQLSVSHQQYEQFVIKWITSSVPKRFVFTNEGEIKRTIAGVRNAFSDDHLYITPQGQFAVLDFDLNDNEFFRSLDTFEQYIDWTINEKARTFGNSFCNQCQYLGRCLTEHLRNVTDVEQSCNGYYKLIEWYKNERMESQSGSVPSHQHSD